MRLKRFLIPSLAAVGLLPQQVVAIPTEDFAAPDSAKATLFEAFKLQHVYLLAGHRSHSSHGSHGSHRSSSGSGYSTPVYTAPAAPLYTPPASDSTAPATILPSSPDAALKTLPGNSDKFLEIAKQVQLALYSWGYYSGVIDGVVGPATRTAISTMQADWNLKVTGTITPEVLNALKIVAE